MINKTLNIKYIYTNTTLIFNQSTKINMYITISNKHINFLKKLSNYIQDNVYFTLIQN